MNVRRLIRTILIALPLVFSLAGFTALESLFAPSADLWPRWQTHDPASKTEVDHGAWSAFLKTYVRTDQTGLNRVAYGGVSEANKKSLHGYLGRMRRVGVSGLSRNEQLAYWINLYNALTVRLILDFYPIGSIRDIDLSSGLFSSGPWDKKLIKIEGEMISLNDIEHRILRPIWNDPRIHYAVNCASVGCPNLATQPYTAARMNAMLDAGAEAYINSPRGVNLTDDGLIVSKIYSWFSRDFGNSEPQILEHLLGFANRETKLKILRAASIDGYAYDWALNGTKR